MSIPVRFDVHLKNGQILHNQSFGTISYGTGHKVLTWYEYLNRFRELDESKIQKYCPWIHDAVSFYITNTGMIIKKVDLDNFYKESLNEQKLG